MELIIHTISGAPRGWRALIGLTLKELPYTIRHLEASKQEHKSEAFLELNPRGTVPVLQAGGLVIPDSLAILAWLDRQFPDKPIFGETAADAALIWTAVTSCNDYLRDAVNQLLGPILVQNVQLSSQSSEQMASLKAAAAQLQVECQALDTQLEDRNFLCGTYASAAEAVAFPEIRLIQRAIDRKTDIMSAVGFSNLSEQFPSLTGWMQRVGSLDGMDNTLPHHW